MVAIAPSILSADFSRLGELVQECQQGKADRIHVDVMDGHFVPNLSMGPIVVKGLRPRTSLPLEVHLMVESPYQFFDYFVAAGCDSLIVHIETLLEPLQYLQNIRALGKKVGLAINPGTPVEAIDPYLDQIDLALCMTVWPGFGGQSFLPESLARIKKLRERIEKRNPRCELEVDGGIDQTTIVEAKNHGANVFVAGTAVFGYPGGPAAGIQNLLQKTAAS